ncbi:hypothetical protein [Limosilactobacillus equigenerosi]|uniref:Uncharacterized protein n=1 Tax=Limosilactobacillus equigenerosi DSM 18793 = JCM 14505 TaxID=1423742 RepID=A0A0R1V321_9LACO|nr:hypothetical protein [Limosilactobacillus equigenerosi]KRL96267.1 hypothetical protein FC21_GL000264 [Limosilactobacillus equigenerosi DSM 18793 = JCM 14505]
MNNINELYKKYKSSNSKWIISQITNNHSEYQSRANFINISNKFLATPENTPILYHYTTYESLKKIIETNEFLLGSIKEMNDSEEIKHTFDLGRIILKELGATQDEIKSFNEIFLAKFVQYDTYLISFTKNNSSMAMQKYGDVALEFKLSEVQGVLAEKFTPKNFELKSGDAYVFPMIVNYDEEFQKRWLYPIVKMILFCIRNTEIEDYIINYYLYSSMYSFYVLSLCFKRHIIHEENEIRILVLRKVTHGESHEEKILNEKPRIVMPLNYQLIKKVIANRSWYGKLPVINNLLSANDFVDTKVELTKLPY